MIDVKKFVVVFLVLAAVASGSALFVLNSGATVPGISKTGATTGQTADINAAPLGNVFAATGATTGVGAGDTVNASGTAVSSDPANLTDQLASSFVNQLVAANPNGV